MRPPRIAILLLFLTASLFLFCRAVFTPARTASSVYPAKVKADKSVWGFMYYNTPFSLFPPNAAISLTDDNSTSFAARPAAFGPKLASRGLSGQLWVGSGFAEDSLDGNGELGCSDLPGWENRQGRINLKNKLKAAAPRVAAPIKSDDLTFPERGEDLLDRDNRANIVSSRQRLQESIDDGTDNYLHEGFSDGKARRDTSSYSTSHADIQSIQEAAEIQGKVVLLMRGGCGFLEKVMWAQRRGAIAVIVGDNQKGGPLIQMFAHGDEVDNVTIPSVFTARTTAHLLSSLTQPGSFAEDAVNADGNLSKAQKGSKSSKPKQKTTTISARTAASPNTPKTSKQQRSPDGDNTPSLPRRISSFSRLFGRATSSSGIDDKSRPPSSGQLDWVLVKDWNEQSDKVIRDKMGGTKAKKTSKSHKSSEDDFVIGVHDWRDPDLRDTSDAKRQTGSEPEKDKTNRDEVVADANGPTGGSITPGSGEYRPIARQTKGKKDKVSLSDESEDVSTPKGNGLLAKFFANNVDNGEVKSVKKAKSEILENLPSDFNGHEGLWVTITPTSSASPFFDTLLVLVVSPLVTLTVVYALLILRARIRRRRWRAPKSVVERLPVRTFHTVAASPSPSPRVSPPATPTQTTPLLPQIPTRPRPRSRTTTGITEEENQLAPSSAVPTPRPRSRNARRREHEKGTGGFSAEWKKYMSRQVECVVCLEEYVDGVSQVMSLPCGHEFHADCM